MEVHSSKHLVLIDGYTYQGPWYEGDTYISYKYPKALAERWRNYFNNQIVDISHELWKDYHFIGSTDRIYVFGRRPYISAIRIGRSLVQTAQKSSLRGKSLSVNRSSTVDSAIPTPDITSIFATMIPHGILIHQMLLILTKAYPVTIQVQHQSLN